MYIPEFWFGVITTLFVEVAMITVAIIISTWKNGGDKE